MIQSIFNFRTVAALALTLTLCQTIVANDARKNFIGGTKQSSVEFSTAKFYLTNSLTGTAVVRECPDCDPLRLKVTPSMVVIDRDVSPLPIQWNARLSTGLRKVDVIYTTDSKNIDQVLIYSAQ